MNLKQGRQGHESLLWRILVIKLMCALSNNPYLKCIWFISSMFICDAKWCFVAGCDWWIVVKNWGVQLTEFLALVFWTAWKKEGKRKLSAKHQYRNTKYRKKLLMWKTLSETDMLQIMVIIYEGKCFHKALIADRDGWGHTWCCLWLLRWILTQSNRKRTCCSFSIILMMITLGAFFLLFTFPSQ